MQWTQQHTNIVVDTAYIHRPINDTTIRGMSELSEQSKPAKRYNHNFVWPRLVVFPRKWSKGFVGWIWNLLVKTWIPKEQDGHKDMLNNPLSTHFRNACEKHFSSWTTCQCFIFNYCWQATTLDKCFLKLALQSKLTSSTRKAHRDVAYRLR